MTWRCIRYPISIFLLSAVLAGCFQSDYTKLVRSELAKGIRQDSLLFGIKFGDTRNDFFGKCFDLNKQRLVTQGPANSSVQFLFTDSLFHDQPTDLRLLFFPNYDKDQVIAEMNMEFSYLAWAPWNKTYQSDSLEIKTKKLLMHWYQGNEFVTANVNNTEIPVKVDANRRILVYIKDAQSVGVKIQDILHPQFKHSTD